MGWCPGGGGQGEGCEENRKWGLRKAMDRTLIAEGTENNGPLLQVHPHSQVLTQGGPGAVRQSHLQGCPRMQVIQSLGLADNSLDQLKMGPL